MADNMRAVAHGIFYERDHTMAAIGGIEGLPSYKCISNNSYQLSQVQSSTSCCIQGDLSLDGSLAFVLVMES